jgi:hypothetical protein
MDHWFDDEGFHFDIVRVRREYPLTHTSIDGWKRTGTRLPLRRLGPMHFGPGFCRWRQDRVYRELP